MSRIRQLDTHLTNMIAAGEVVERPAGIVKELVENSIDAGSTHIEVRIVEGGMQHIEISDDGIGMDAEDLSLAFERHSTSKIATAHDLSSIGTFGFRGEALPSIASVSVVEATSNNGEVGHRIIINNGRKSEVSRFARNKGTTISVKELFLKTPARLKYIKNINYENSIILDIIHKFAMGNPQISFTLYLDGRLSFRSYGKNDMKDVFHRVYGPSITTDTKYFKESNYDFEIEGLMAAPQHNRANRNSIWLYINDRMIRYPKAQRAIAESYRRHMPVDRYPIVVMKIKVNPSLVDVNVHPSKWEIRMSKELQLVELIHECLEGILNTSSHAQRMIFKPKEPQIQQSFIQDLREPIVTKSIEVNERPTVSWQSTLIKTEDSEDTKQTVVDQTEPMSQGVKEELPVHRDTYEIENHEKENIEPLQVLAQLSGKYILCQADTGLYIIDQHAAMERVRYEYYQNQLLERNNAMQNLLVPFVFEGRSKLVLQSEHVNQVLKPLYIELEPFGEDSFVLRMLPVWIKEKEVLEFINKVLDMIESERSVREEDLRRRAIATLACHSSVRFNEYLSYDEMVSLVESLRACNQPFHCPHGRPTLISIDHKTLEKEFVR